MTSSPLLRGEATGANLAEILENAKKIAAAFFEVDADCVSVRLSEPARVTEASESYRRDVVIVIYFAAEFEAQEHHALNRANIGPDKCKGCGRDSWPDSPLPQARWS